MTKAKPKSEFYKGTTIPNALLDELMNQLPAMPTQADLFGPEGVVKQLSAALIERCLQAELSTHLGYEKNQRAEEVRPNHRNGSTLYLKSGRDRVHWERNETRRRRTVNLRVHRGSKPDLEMRSRSSATPIENRTVSEAFPAG